MSMAPGGMSARGIRGSRSSLIGDDDPPPLSLALFKRLLGLMSPYARKRNTLIALVVTRAIQLPLIGYATAWIIHGPIAAGDFVGVCTGVLGLLLFIVFTQVTFHFRQRLSQEMGEAVVHDLRRDIFAKLQVMSMRYYDRTKLGRIISRMTSDAEAVRAGVQDVLFVSLVQGGQMLVAAIIMAWVDWVLFLVVLAMAPPLAFLTHYFRNRLGRAYQDVQESFSRVTSTLAESVNGIRVTQGFVRQDVNTQRFSNLVDEHSEYNMKTSRLSGVFLPLLELNNQFFIAVMLVLGGVQTLRWSGTPEGTIFAADDPREQFDALVTYFFMVPQFFGPVAQIGRQWNQTLTSLSGADRVFRLLDTDPESLDRADAVVLDQLEGRVAFEEVTFGYDPGKPVLHGISFEATPGQTIALVGTTGSGKSTVIKLISKFYLPSSGKVLIDGVATGDLDSDSLISQLGIVLQSNFLFTGTVMDNIRLGKRGATDADVIAAAERLDCLDLLEQLPDGLHTQVGERGTALSLGQRQLVCFCRAMLADPRILILDEATSSVDTITEARIQRALEQLLRGRTSFVVAHRLSTIRHADRVLVLDHGKIIERGSHNELLARGGVYANLYRQFIHATEA